MSSWSSPLPLGESRGTEKVGLFERKEVAEEAAVRIGQRAARS